MKTKWKIVLVIALVVLGGGGIIASIKYSQRGIVTVQTGKVVRQDLVSTVTASGEIKPRNYINLGANAMGPLAAILVKEGDHVAKARWWRRLRPRQAQPACRRQQATIQSALADAAAAEANEKSMDDAIANAEATLEKTKAALDVAKLNLDRANQLFKDKLIAKQDYDQKKADYDTAVAQSWPRRRPAWPRLSRRIPGDAAGCFRAETRGPDACRAGAHERRSAEVLR